MGSSTSLVGVLSMVMSFTGIISQRYWDRIVDQRGSRWVTAAGALCTPAVPWIWAVVHRPWQVLLASVPGGFVSAGLELARSTVLLELPAQGDQTRVTVGYTTLVNVASILGPIFGGWLVKPDRVSERLSDLWLWPPFGRAAVHVVASDVPAA